MRILRKDWELLNRVAWSILNGEIRDEENYLNLESNIDTFKMLGKLDTPLFVHILISSLCITINLIRSETNELETIRIANRALLIMKEIKKRRTRWKFQFCSISPKNSDRKIKKSQRE
jgi:hypothetical protein